MAGFVESLRVGFLVRYLLAALVIGLTTLTTIAASHARGYEDSMAQRLLACTGCHGDQGRAGPDGYYPRIAGKPAGYLYQQLLNFRDGRRHYEVMRRLLAPLSDQYLYEIAEHFAAQQLPYAPPSAAQTSASALARGAQLITQGDSALGVPACQSCHGERLTGVLPNAPGLLGLPRDYLNAQLGAWRNDQRRALSPDCMARIAKKLTPADVSAVSGWLAAQPLPADTRPAAAGPSANATPLNRDCASALEVPKPMTGTASTMSQGEYLARIGNCAGCHSARGGEPYAGGVAIDTPFGTVYSSNLTPDPQTGIGRWSKDDFWRAMHDGQSRDGRLLLPAFPFSSFTLMSRNDSDALFDWLMRQPAAAQANQPNALRWPFGTQLALRVWRALYFKPGEFKPNREQNESWNRGAYLVESLGHCGACHTPRNRWGASDATRALTGATMPMGDWYAPALRGTGPIDIVTQAQYLQSGRRTTRHPAESIHAPADARADAPVQAPTQASMSGPMAEVVLHSTQFLSDRDALAVASYLAKQAQDDSRQAAASLVPSRSEPDASAPWRGTPTTRGAQLYETHCADCHGRDGKRMGAGYPDLAGNSRVTQAQSINSVNTVLYGGFAAATARHPRPFGMPPFLLVLDDRDVAEVLSYIRGAWGNSAGAVRELDVAARRGSIRR